MRTVRRPTVPQAFAGSAPPAGDLLVGEIRGLRTFRVDDCGWLLPLYSDGCWYDGPNTAVCTPPTGDRRAAHPVPDEHCECGLYAYGSPAAAAQARASRYVQAVVSCWGGVVAGTQGLRAEHARIDAIWLHPHAPRWLRQRVAGRYPSARMYADADAMLAEFPLTELSCYRPPRPASRLRRAAALVLAAVVLVLGLVPAAALHTHPALGIAWLAATGATTAVGVWFLGSKAVGHLSGAAICCAVLVWLLADPLGFLGWTGAIAWLLRLPLLRALVVVAGVYLLPLLPRHFPVERVSERRRLAAARA